MEWLVGASTFDGSRGRFHLVSIIVERRLEMRVPVFPERRAIFHDNHQLIKVVCLAFVGEIAMLAPDANQKC